MCKKMLFFCFCFCSFLFPFSAPIFAGETTQDALVDLFFLSCEKEEIPKILNARFEIEGILQEKKVPCKKVILQNARIRIIVGQNEFCFYWGEKKPQKNSVFLLRVNDSPYRCIWGENEQDWKDYNSFLKMDDEGKETFLRSYFEKYGKVKVPYPASSASAPATATINSAKPGRIENR